MDLIPYKGSQDDQTYLVKADQFHLATDVDPGRADTEDAAFLESVLGVDGTDRHGGRQRGRHDDRDNVQGPQDDLSDMGLGVAGNTTLCYF